MQSPYSNSFSGSSPIVISRSVESQVYSLFALAIALTTVGVYVGNMYAAQLSGTGISILMLIASFGIILTSSLWAERYPLNYILFGAFPLISGITLSFYLNYLLAQYVNGGSILLNALGATASMGVAAAIFARTTSWNLQGMGRVLFFALIGLLVLSLMQVFIPGLRTGQMELLLSGAGVVIFAGFLTYDLQRIQTISRYGGNAFMLALSLYLDIYNLFLYVLRLMTAISGERR